MFNTIYHLTLLRGFLRRVFRVGECSICYDSAPLYSLHSNETNLHGMCRSCMGFYNQTVCHMCRNPVPEEVLLRWRGIRIEEDDSDDSDDDSDDDYVPEPYNLSAVMEEYEDSDEEDVPDLLAQLEAIREEMLQITIIQDMNSLVENWNTATFTDLSRIVNRANGVLQSTSSDFLSTENLTMVYEVVKLLEVAKKYDFTQEYVSSLWNRIQNHGTLETRSEMIYACRPVSLTLINHIDFHGELADIPFAISEIEYLLMKLEESPGMSYERFRRIADQIDHEVSKLDGKILDTYSFDTDTGNVTLSVLVSKEYNL